MSKLKPLIKYPGGKLKELKEIEPQLPKEINNYYEPFFGGGAVYFSLLPGKQRFINDISADLINLYRCIKDDNADFYKELKDWTSAWTAAEKESKDNLEPLREHYLNGTLPESENELRVGILKKKFQTLKKIEEESGSVIDFDKVIETAYKQALYDDARKRYNARTEYDGIKAALFLIMRQYAYSGMFRFNNSGEFNVPYGGKSYNKQSLSDRIEYFRSDEVKDALGKTVIGNSDFLDFMTAHPPAKGDFAFIDSPYDTEFSDYDNNGFGKDDQRRLADYMINGCLGNWMVVIKATEFIRQLYPVGTVCANGGEIRIDEFDKKYSVSCKNRNKKDCKHLIITSYSDREDDAASHEA